MHEMDTMHSILVFKIILSTIGLLFHLVGVYALKMSKKWNNQVIILLNLSISEIITLINDIVDDSIDFILHKNTNQYDTDAYKKTSRLIQYTVISEVNLTLMLMTVERLICIVSPLNYNVIIQEKSVIQKMILLSWGRSILTGVLTLFPKTYAVVDIIGYASIIITLSLFVITYTVIGYKIKMSGRSVQNNVNTSQRRVQKYHLVPALIILTFVILYGIPLTLRVFYVNIHPLAKISPLLVLCLRCVPTIGFIADALIYIFLTKDNRDVIIKLLRC